MGIRGLYHQCYKHMDNKIGLRQQAGQIILAQKESIHPSSISTFSVKIYTSLPSVVRAILDGTMNIIR